MEEQESIIVAIELGSSRISGIAGKMKDGTMQILAYAEDKSTDCIKRGIVYNIEKTTQGIKNVISKLETSLKMKINRTYIGLGGQSVRSIRSVIKKNMLTPTYITQAHIDAITDESHEVPFDDCELIGYYVQGFTVDTSQTNDPVGIVGTNIEGEFLNVVANTRIRSNIKTCFENMGLEITDYRLSAFNLANNVLTDAEKRTGTVLVDIGAGTTTIVVLKNNIVRQITTLPLGINNIKQDLCELQIEYHEAEQLLLTYGDAIANNDIQNGDDQSTPVYTTSDGRTIEIAEIQQIIKARLQEILLNVDNQIHNTEYADKLLGGAVITGGGSNIKNIDKACLSTLKVDKIRIAKKVIPQLIKNSDITTLSIESPITCTIIALLLSGTENCVGAEYNGPDIFREQEKEKEISVHKEAALKIQKEEEAALQYIEETKNKLRESIINLRKAITDVEADDSNKKLKEAAIKCIEDAGQIITEDYTKNKELLIDKDKYKQSLREADDLINKCDEESDRLGEIIREANKRNSALGKIARWFDDLLKE